MSIPHEYSYRYASANAAQQYADLHTHAHGLKNLRAMTITGLEARGLLSLIGSVGPVDRLLELPTGTGRMTPRLAPYARDLVGGDVSLSMLDSCRRVMSEPHKARAVTSLNLGVMETGSIPLADNSVDVVVCHRLFHQVPDSVRLPALREMRRVARKAVIASFAVTGGIYTWRHRLRSLVPLGHPEHAIPHPIDTHDLEILMSNAGLRVVRRTWTAPFFSSQVILLTEPED